MIIRFFAPLFAAAAIFPSNGWAQIAPPTSPQAATARPTRRQHGPAQIHGRRPDNTVESTNWSGYAVTGSDFTDAEGSWVVPSVNCSVTPGTKASPTYSSFWVGIDGYASSTVEQIGTDSDCNGSTAVYYAWYEFYPAFPVNNILPLAPGDTISAKVHYDGSEFTVTITNETTGGTFSKRASVKKAKRTSAEWIAEAPCCARGGNSLPLADFSVVNFGAAYKSVNYPNVATEGLATDPIAGFPPATIEQIDMITSSGAPEATTLPNPNFAIDGISDFTVTWNAE